MLHFSFLLGSFGYAAVHQRAEPGRKFFTFSIIFVNNKWKSSLTWLLSNILNVKNRSKKWVERVFVSLLLPGSLFIT